MSEEIKKIIASLEVVGFDCLEQMTETLANAGTAAIPAILERLGQPLVGDRGWFVATVLCGALGEFAPQGAEAAVPVLTALAAQARAAEAEHYCDPREAFVEALAKYGPAAAAAAPGLIKLLGEHRGLAYQAALAIGQLGAAIPPAQVSELGQMILTGPVESRRRAAGALQDLGSAASAAEGQILQVLADPSAAPEVLLAATTAAGNIGTPAALDALQAAVKSADPAIQVAAIAGLQSGGRWQEGFTRILLALSASPVKESVPKWRTAAGNILTSLGVDAVPAVAGELTSPDPASRIAASKKLLAWATPSNRSTAGSPALAAAVRAKLAALIAALGDQNREVADNAAEAVFELGARSELFAAIRRGENGAVKRGAEILSRSAAEEHGGRKELADLISRAGNRKEDTAVRGVALHAVLTADVPGSGKDVLALCQELLADTNVGLRLDAAAGVIRRAPLLADGEPGDRVLAKALAILGNALDAPFEEVRLGVRHALCRR